MKPNSPASTRDTLVALLATAALSLWLLARPIADFGTRLWGPERPWTHRDFLGAWYLFWAAAQPGDPLTQQSWPDGALPTQFHIPNPFDAWLLGPLVNNPSFPAPFPLWWDLMQLGHHLGNVLAATWLVRALGGRALSALAAGALVAASPVMLHEIAGGRTLSGAVWPGLLALGLLVSTRDLSSGWRARGWRRAALAGLLIGLQGLFYVYTGLLFGIVALILCPAWTLLPPLLLTATLITAPYLAWLAPVWNGAQTRPPDAGFSHLPVAGLLGLHTVQERFRLHPALLLGVPALLASARSAQPSTLSHRRGRLAAAILLTALVALGPTPTWDGGAVLFTSPMAWAGTLFPPLARMHHPIRAALLLVPLLAVGLSTLLDRLPWPLTLATGMLALPFRHDVELGAPWSAMVPPEGLEQALWLRDHTADEHIGAIVDLTGNQGGALALQPIHQRPMLEGLRKELPDKDRQVGWLRQGVDPWLSGEQVGAQTLSALRSTGFTHVLVVSRGSAVPQGGLEADLGPPVFPGIYPLSPAAGCVGRRQPGRTDPRAHRR